MRKKTQVEILYRVKGNDYRVSLQGMTCHICPANLFTYTRGNNYVVCPVCKARKKIGRLNRDYEIKGKL